MASVAMQGPATATITPHPVLLDGQRVGVELIRGETLGEFLRRAVPDDFGDHWEVRVQGYPVPATHWNHVRPKDGTVVEVRSMVNRQALYLVAMAALTYFTFGVGAAAGGWAGVSAAVGGGIGGAIAAGAVYVAGPVLIPRVIA